MPSPAPGRGRLLPSGYNSSLQLKNSGGKAITAVEWDHVFYADKARLNEPRRFKLKKEVDISPGEWMFVSQSVSLKGDPKLTTKPRQNVEIGRVEYADGTVWRRPQIHNGAARDRAAPFVIFNRTRRDHTAAGTITPSC